MNFFASHAAIVRRLALVFLLTFLPLYSHAQYSPFGGPPGGGRRGGGAGGRGGRGGGGGVSRGMTPEEAELMQQIQQTINPDFQDDVFTFARLYYPNAIGAGRQWQDDSPDADYNLIFRLFQVTSLKVRPKFNPVNITPRELDQQPFVYLAAAGNVMFSDAEAKNLRDYLNNGGFMMAEDFWGDYQLQHFAQQMNRVLPGRSFVPLPLDHPIFHAVFNFKYLPQMPSVGPFVATGESWDPEGGRGGANIVYVNNDHEPHYFGIFDDKQRLMVIICHNNHFGDGWEHEGDDHTYFDRFSAPQAYPMFINILFYAMTH